jgi:hypothetical protein
VFSIHHKKYGDITYVLWRRILIMLSWLWYVILKGATEFLQIHALAVALYEAEAPGSNGEGLLEVATVLEFFDELVENLARLGRG